MTRPLTLVILLLTFVAISYSAETEDWLQIENGTQGRQCGDYLKGVWSKVKLWFRGKWTRREESESDGTAESQAKCWIKCLLDKANVLQQGSMDLNQKVLAQKMKLFSPEEQAKFAENSAKCKETALKETNACDIGFVFVDCLNKALKTTKAGGSETPAEEPTTMEDI